MNLSNEGYYFRNDRALLRVEGEDRVKFLHSLTTNDVKNAKVNSFHTSCILSPMGKILSEFHLFFFEDFIWLETDRSLLENTTALLNRYKLASRVMIRDISQEWEQTLIIGSRRKNSPGNPIESHSFEPYMASNARCVFTKTEQHAAWLDALSCEKELREFSEQDYHRFRISRGIPIYGTDVGPDNIIKEIPYFESAISYTKGCYPGQEIVARLHSRGGNISKRLVGIEVPETSNENLLRSSVYFQEQQVGIITSTTMVDPISSLSLAMVHRTAFEPGTNVTVRNGDFSAQGTIVSLAS